MITKAGGNQRIQKNQQHRTAQLGNCVVFLFCFEQILKIQKKVVTLQSNLSHKYNICGTTNDVRATCKRLLIK